jgi:hypothetical protein
MDRRDGRGIEGICGQAWCGTTRKLSQREIAGWFGKTETYVSKNLRAYSIRKTADKEGIDTSRISTGALCEIAAAGDDIPKLLKRIAEEGGSVQAARKIGREYRTNTETTAPEPSMDRDPTVDEKIKATISALDDEPNDIRSGRKEPPQHRESASRLPPSWREPGKFDPPHRDVDINNVLIHDYIGMAESRFAPSEAKNRQDAAWDIIALLHETLL